jgi:hypothetical protein
MSDVTKPDYFGNLVQQNFTGLSQYFVLIQTQSRQSFRIVCIAGVAGLSLILLGVILGLYSRDYSNIAYLSGGAGVATEIISAFFFRLYGETQKQLAGYQDKMIQVQNLTIAYKLIEDTIDENRKNIMREALMTRMFAPSSTPPAHSPQSH